MSDLSFICYLISSGLGSISGIFGSLSYFKSRDINKLKLYTPLDDKSLSGYHYLEGFLTSKNTMMLDINNNKYSFLIYEEHHYQHEKVRKLNINNEIQNSLQINVGWEE